MKLVLDNNILFSVMNPGSAAAYLFAMLRADFSAPEFIKSEFNEYNEDCLYKSGLSEHEFELRRSEVFGSIKFFKVSEYGQFLKTSVKALPDSDDADFLALALSINSAVWSNDPHLKQQSLAEAYTTKELIEKLLSGSL